MTARPTLDAVMTSDAAVYREAVRLLEVGGFCREPTCGWACCAISKAVGETFSPEETARYHRIHQRFVDRYAGSYWWGKPRTSANQIGRITALLTLATELEMEECTAKP